MTEITRERIDNLMKRCQIGVGPRQMNEAHDIMAECYGTLGAMMSEIEALRSEIRGLAQAMVRTGTSILDKDWK
jgi:hypothetical protein